MKSIIPDIIKIFFYKSIKMIKNLFQKLLKKSGKKYEIDPRIPSKLILLTLYKRVIMLLRGILLTRKKIFVDVNTIIYNSKNISFGKSVTIEKNWAI